MSSVLRKITSLAAIGTAALTLAACGGGSDANNSFLNLRGVAATGLAISGGAVDVQCASGTGSATTLANGSYSVVVTNGEGPCLVTVTSGSIILRSIAPKTTSGTAVANVTPISNAIVTALVSSKGASSVTELVSNTAFIPSSTDLTAAVTAAITKINIALAAAGHPQLPLNMDLLGKTDFVAATPGTPSTDPLDLALDQLVPEGSTDLPANLVSDIGTGVQAVVKVNATGGATGGVN